MVVPLAPRAYAFKTFPARALSPNNVVPFRNKKLKARL